MPVKSESKASYNLPPSESKCGTLCGNIDDKHTYGVIENETTSQNILGGVALVGFHPSSSSVFLAVGVGRLKRSFEGMRGYTTSPC